VFDLANDEETRSIAERLITLEEDPKYRKKYATVWRTKKTGSPNKPSTAGSAQSELRTTLKIY
jgi:hypothetical protein